jgi:hypothetical protein
MVGKVVALSLRRATLAIGEEAISIQISGWSGGESHELVGGRNLEVSVERAGDRMPIEFFPMYFLSLRAGGQEVKALHAHSSETLDSVRQAICAWQQRRSGGRQSVP